MSSDELTLDETLARLDAPDAEVIRPPEFLREVRPERPARPQGTAPSERARAACTRQHLRDYLEQANPSARAGHKGSVRCPTPDHEDNDPSTTVFGPDGNAAWQCKSCGASGTILDAVMDVEGCGFEHAVRRACEITGISYDTPRPAAAAPARARRRPAPAIEDTPAPAPAPAAPVAPATPADYPELWELGVGEWALDVERTAGWPALAVINAACAEAVARCHGWTIRGDPPSFLAANVGPSGGGKTRAARWARDRVAWPPAARWHWNEHDNAAADGAAIARFAPESAEGLIDRLAKGRRPEPGTPEADQAGDEALPFPSIIVAVDEGEYLWPARHWGQADNIRRDIRTLWSGERLDRYRKASADTPPRIVNHRPTVTAVACMTHEPAARLLADTDGDATRWRMVHAVCLTAEMPDGPPPADWEPAGAMSDPGPGRPAVRIPDDVRTEIDERAQACRNAARELRETDDSGHVVTCELAAAAGLAILEHGEPHITAETWAAAKALTRADRAARSWIAAAAADERRRAAAGRGVGEAHAAKAKAKAQAAQDRDLVAEAAAAIARKAAKAEGGRITRNDATRALGRLAGLWRRQTNLKPAALTTAALDHLAEHDAWTDTTGPAPPGGGHPTRWFGPPGTEPPAERERTADANREPRTADVRKSTEPPIPYPADSVK